MNNDLTVSKWIQERIEQIPSAHWFVLLHASAEFGGMGGEPLLRAKVFDDETNITNVERRSEEIASQMIASAASHVAAFDGMRQRYKIVAEDEESNVIASHAFVRGSKTATHEVDLSESPTERGLLAQLMRHNDSKDRQIADMVQGTMGALMAENKHLRDQRDQWEHRRLEMFLKLEALNSEEHVRALEMKELEADQERKAKMLDAVVTKFGPLLLGQAIPALMGGGRNGHKSQGQNGLSAPAQESRPDEKPEKPDPKTQVSQAQNALREVFKVIDRMAIYESIDDATQAKLDNCLGIGDDPADFEAFRDQLTDVWEALPEEATMAVLERMSSHPEHAIALTALLGIGQ